MLRLAPSASNKQPWQIIKDGSSFHFHLEESKLYRMILKYNLQRLDMGIAMCHFELTVNQLGLKGKWKKENQVLDINNKKSNIKYIVSWISE